MYRLARPFLLAGSTFPGSCPPSFSLRNTAVVTGRFSFTCGDERKPHRTIWCTKEGLSVAANQSYWLLPSLHRSCCLLAFPDVTWRKPYFDCSWWHLWPWQLEAGRATLTAKVSWRTKLGLCSHPARSPNTQHPLTCCNVTHIVSHYRNTLWGDSTCQVSRLDGDTPDRIGPCLCFVALIS